MLQKPRFCWQGFVCAQKTKEMPPMTKRTRRIPTYAIDHDKQAIVLVPLANHHEPAKLFPEDFHRLMEWGYSDQWVYNRAGTGHPYVRCSSSRVAGAHETVARVLVNPGTGHIVQYHDGDRLNLRADNLYTNKGYAKGQTIVSAEDDIDGNA